MNNEDWFTVGIPIDFVMNSVDIRDLDISGVVGLERWVKFSEGRTILCQGWGGIWMAHP